MICKQRQNMYCKDKNGNLTQNTYDGVYFIHNPMAQSNGYINFGELGVAGYQKFLEGNLGLSLGNSTVQAKELMQEYGKKNLFIGAHSRGTLTAKNAMDALNTKENREKGVLSDTTMKFVGAAANLENSDKTFNQLQGNEVGKDGKRTEKNAETAILFDSQAGDFVNGFPVGFNPATREYGEIERKPVLNDDGSFKIGEDGKVVTEKRGWWEVPLNIIGAFGAQSSAHNCLGQANPNCVSTGYRKDQVMHPEKTAYEMAHPEYKGKGESK